MGGVTGGSVALAVSVCVFFWALSHRPVILDVDQSQNDPSYGALPQSVGLAVKSDGQEPVLAVYLGPCTSCSLKGFDPTPLKALNAQKVAIVIGEIDQAQEKVLLSTFGRILHDDSGEIGHGLNAYFQPRGYLFANSRGLVGIQQEDQTMEAFLESAK